MGEEGLWISLLGPLEVRRDGVQIALLPGRSEVLLTMLAVSAGRPVGLDTLAAGIWGDAQPEHVRGSLHTVATRLRKAIGKASVVATREGYLLDVDPDRVDLLRFRRLVAQAQEAGSRDGTHLLLTQALALWRGRPLLGELLGPAFSRSGPSRPSSASRSIWRAAGTPRSSPSCAGSSARSRCGKPPGRS
jgi:DNA-binding SARP family transcriptional activator